MIKEGYQDRSHRQRQTTKTHVVRYGTNTTLSAVLRHQCWKSVVTFTS